ncbi:uncharacterized protein LOC108988322 isoform X3 [Juglans regia]|uniref:Uncharacterized protein LOC108988322 isoform X3 n=1 Tax=Juglans regia TaxID=51240 RepID=A0A6P9DXY8_JUGRE|nr:uncharacterized protein LOC108988322 isoform X3 [Juglans regia]
MAESSLQLISEIGAQLGRQTRSGKDSILKSLKQAANALSEIEQPSSQEAAKKLGAAKKIEVAINPLRKAIVNGLIQHKDKEVRLLVAICLSEIFRVMAPEPPFEDKYLREIFKLVISTFAELADTTSPFFSRRVKILETVARCKCCVIMLDIDCNDLVLEMFSIFFLVVRENHQQSLINHIVSIMTHILTEETSQTVVDVILRNLVNEGKGAPSASYQLAVSISQHCAEKLEPFVRGFLTACILDRDAVENELKEFYHEIIFKLFQCAPQMLLAVIPNLTHELLTDQVDVRIKAVNLIGKLFGLPEQHVAKHYRDLFLEFLKRFSDKSVEVRVSALQCVKAFYLANPSGTALHEVLTALEDRLLDFDDRVRMQAVIVACDLAQSNLKSVPPKLISQATERLRDKKISVRKKALHKLMEVYQDYCKKCSEGHMAISDHFEQILCKVLMLCYDKDCKEFRSQNMEIVLAEDLFPAHLSVEERTRHWIHLFSIFTPLHIKALNSILSQKRRLQKEMQIYLALRKKEKENSSEEMQKRMKTSIIKMVAFFPDPSKAEDSFNKLSQMKDNSIFNSLALLLDDMKFRDALNNRAIISIFPSLLRGSEVQLQMLIEENHQINDRLIEVLAKAGPHICVQLSDIYPILQRVCLEGSRTQAKFAVAAIAALAGASEQFFFSELCKELVDSLHSRRNIPTILQSLGCVAQYSLSTFEAQNREIVSFIKENIFQAGATDDLNSPDATSGCCNSCQLKIYGLKTLVKSFLPHRGTHVRRQINEVLDILSKMLQKGDVFDGIISCESDRAHIRLAAAKSVLQLSRRWDLHISPEIFCFTLFMAKDSSSLVRRLFLNKTHNLLKEHAIPIRYASVFALATSDCLKDLQDDSFKYMAEFIKEYSREARICQASAGQGGSVTDYPAYIVVFLIYLLAHDTGFPHENCRDEQIYAQFCSPLFNLLEALVNATIVDGDMDLVNDARLLLLSIFRAVKKAEDAADAQNTPKLHIIADIGFSFVAALNYNGVSSSHAPALVLLPSSLYRANSQCLTCSSADDSFVSRIVYAFKSQICVPVTSLPKRGRKCQEDNTQSDIIKNHTLILAPHKKVDFSRTGTETQTNVRQDISVGQRRRQAVSPASESVGLHECSTINNQHGASKKSEKILENKQLSSSCDSVTLRSSLAESHVSIQIPESNSSSFKENVRAGGTITAEHSKYSRAKLKDPCNLNVVLPEESNTFQLQHNNLKRNVDTIGDVAAQQQKVLTIEECQKFPKRTTLPGVKARKGQKASIDTSEVTNLNEDAVVKGARRRK